MFISSIFFRHLSSLMITKIKCYLSSWRGLRRIGKTSSAISSEYIDVNRITVIIQLFLASLCSLLFFPFPSFEFRTSSVLEQAHFYRTRTTFKAVAFSSLRNGLHGVPGVSHAHRTGKINVHRVLVLPDEFFFSGLTSVFGGRFFLVIFGSEHLLSGDKGLLGRFLWNCFRVVGIVFFDFIIGKRFFFGLVFLQLGFLRTKQKETWPVRFDAMKGDLVCELRLSLDLKGLLGFPYF